MHSSLRASGDVCCSPTYKWYRGSVGPFYALGVVNPDVQPLTEQRCFMARQKSAIYGFSNEVAAFEQRHPNFNAKLSNLYRAINLAFVRTQDVNSLADRFFFFFGAILAEDFNEVLLVAVNGYGAAARKLLRTMYEFTVTLFI